MPQPESVNAVALAEAAIALQRHIDAITAERTARYGPSIEDALCALEQHGWVCVITTAAGGFEFNAAHPQRPCVKEIATTITEAARKAYHRAIREAGDAAA